MTDDERMDRARRIREMREGSRPDDEAQADDHDEPADDGASDVQPDDHAGEAAADEQPVSGDGGTDTSSTAGDAAVSAVSADAAVSAVSADSDDTESDTPEESATDDGGDTHGTGDSQEGDDEGSVHIPGADVGDVDVDVEEMARQAGVGSADADPADTDPTGADGADTAPAAGAATGGQTDSPTDSDEAGGPTVGRGAVEAGASADETRVLEFSLGAEQYCLDIEYVEEIVKRETVTRVPNTPEYVEGVVDLRGQITTILDPKVLLDIPDDGSKDLIVVFDPERFDDQGAVGWVVDDVKQVMPIAESEVNASPVDQDHINGVVDRDGEFVIWTTPELDLEEATG